MHISQWSALHFVPWTWELRNERHVPVQGSQTMYQFGWATCWVKGEGFKIFWMGLQVIPSKLVSNPIPNQQPRLPWKDLPFGSFGNFLRRGVDTWAARWVDLWVPASIPNHASKHIWSWRDSCSTSSLILFKRCFFPKSNLETFLFQQDSVVDQWHHDKSL